MGRERRVGLAQQPPPRGGGAERKPGRGAGGGAVGELRRPINGLGSEGEAGRGATWRRSRGPGVSNLIPHPASVTPG